MARKMQQDLEDLSQKEQALFAHFKWNLKAQKEGPTQTIPAYGQG